MRDVLKVKLETFEEKYLGLPTPDGRTSRGKFQNLQSRLFKRIMAWGDTLSLAGKETMIKAVTQAIPTYIMGIFKLTFSVCDDHTTLVRAFIGARAKDKGRDSLHLHGWLCSLLAVTGQVLWSVLWT